MSSFLVASVYFDLLGVIMCTPNVIGIASWSEDLAIATFETEHGGREGLPCLRNTLPTAAACRTSANLLHRALYPKREMEIGLLFWGPKAWQCFHRVCFISGRCKFFLAGTHSTKPVASPSTVLNTTSSHNQGILHDPF